MDANLTWWANNSFGFGPVLIAMESPEAGRLHDLGQLEALREIHGADALFTLQFADGSEIDVLISRPDDHGQFGITTETA